MIFSDNTKSKAIESIGGELAWKKEAILQAIDELIEKKYAILGVEVWALVKNDIQYSFNKLTTIDAELIAIGIIKGKDNLDYVFAWHSKTKSNETWKAFVLRTRTEAVEAIAKLDAENTVQPDLQNSLYYNLDFVNEAEFEKLK